jgi:hypothetical protein
VVRDIVWTGVVVGVFDVVWRTVLLYRSTGGLNGWIWLVYGSLLGLYGVSTVWIPVPSIIKGSILEINHLLIGIHTGDGALMAGYSVIAVWIREVDD